LLRHHFNVGEQRYGRHIPLGRPWENNANNFNAVDISMPAAITVFPGEIYRAPRSWAERSYHKLIYFNEVDKGGHFAAWEQPELFNTEIRAAFRSLRPPQNG
jgi:pimeloyl-ACP methyl ester carboxylesterase